VAVIATRVYTTTLQPLALCSVLRRPGAGGPYGPQGTVAIVAIFFCECAIAVAIVKLSADESVAVIAVRPRAYVTTDRSPFPPAIKIYVRHARCARVVLCCTWIGLRVPVIAVAVELRESVAIVVDGELVRMRRIAAEGE
jgi:hypothetical protein